MYQNLSVTLVQADIDALFAALSTLEQKMPFLVTLDPTERRTLMKLGPRSADFVKDALDAVMAVPSVMPQSFDVAEFKRDADLFDVLSRLKMRLDSICEKVDHTYMAAGNEAMTASLEAYAYVRTASKRTPGLQSIADKLHDRFRGQGRRSKSEDDNIDNETQG